MAENDPKSDRFSLHGISPEDAIRKMFAAKRTAFSIGDRVEVSEACRDEECRGRTGEIITAQNGQVCDILKGAEFYWVKFDDPILRPNDCLSISGEFRADWLRRI